MPATNKNGSPAIRIMNFCSITWLHMFSWNPIFSHSKPFSFIHNIWLTKKCSPQKNRLDSNWESAWNMNTPVINGRPLTCLNCSPYRQPWTRLLLKCIMCSVVNSLKACSVIKAPHLLIHTWNPLLNFQLLPPGLSWETPPRSTTYTPLAN